MRMRIRIREPLTLDPGWKKFGSRISLIAQANLSIVPFIKYLQDCSKRNNCSNERRPGIHILGGKPKKHSGKGDREEGKLFSYMETSTLPLKHPSICRTAWKEITVMRGCLVSYSSLSTSTIKNSSLRFSRGPGIYTRK
jgi:hypothetical protein